MFTVPRKRPHRSGAICLGCGGLATFLAPGRGTYGLVRSADQTVPGLWPNGCCDPVAAAEFQRSSRGRSCPPEAGAGQELPSRGRSRAAAAAATPGRATGDFDGKKRVLTGVNASTKRRSFDGQHALTKLIDVSLGRTRRDFGTFGPSERLCMFFGCR